MDSSKLQEDRTEISEVVFRYATGVDSKDWMLFGTCFTDPMEADMTATLLATGAPQQFPLERWRRVTERTLSPWKRTQHYMSNLTIKVNGDRAQCVAYLMRSTTVPTIRKASLPTPWAATIPSNSHARPKDGRSTATSSIRFGPKALRPPGARFGVARFQPDLK